MFEVEIGELCKLTKHPAKAKLQMDAEVEQRAIKDEVKAAREERIGQPVIPTISKGMFHAMCDTFRQISEEPTYREVLKTSPVVKTAHRLLTDYRLAPVGFWE